MLQNNLENVLFLELFHDEIQIKNNPRWGKKTKV